MIIKDFFPRQDAKKGKFLKHTVVLKKNRGGGVRVFAQVPKIFGKIFCYNFHKIKKKMNIFWGVGARAVSASPLECVMMGTVFES